MVFFGLGKKNRIVDLGERYRKSEENKGISSDSNSSDSSGNQNDGSFSGTPEEKKRKLIKMITDTARKLDEISTQIYHLQQRVELLERKAGVGTGI